jgi:hypothetical protein
MLMVTPALAIKHPGPRIIGLDPSSGHPGETLQVRVLGENFQDLARILFYPFEGITVNSVKFFHTYYVANMTIAGNATIGPRNVTVTNPDWSSDTLRNGFIVIGARAEAKDIPATAEPAATGQGEAPPAETPPPAPPAASPAAPGEQGNTIAIAIILAAIGALFVALVKMGLHKDLGDLLRNR